MAQIYRISAEAKSDLDHIWLYLAKRNIVAADAVIEACFSGFLEVAKQPGIGHLRPDTPGDCRCKPLRKFRNYIIIYRLSDRTLEIARVLHGAMDFESQFDGEQE